MHECDNKEFKRHKINTHQARIHFRFEIQVKK